MPMFLSINNLEDSNVILINLKRVVSIVPKGDKAVIDLGEGKTIVVTSFCELIKAIEKKFDQWNYPYRIL